MVFPASFFFIFVFSIQLTVNKCTIWSLLMTGFEPRTSGVRSDCSTNWAITTAHEAFFLPIVGNLFSVPSQWLTRCFFKQDLQDFVKFQLILPFLSANRYFRYFPLFFLDICHSTAVVRCTRMMAYNQDKAFVWLEKVKIRKGNPTNASNGLKYFLFSWNDLNRFLWISGSSSYSRSLQRTTTRTSTPPCPTIPCPTWSWRWSRTTTWGGSNAPKGMKWSTPSWWPQNWFLR